jgi:hypothetical protein
MQPMMISLNFIVKTEIYKSIADKNIDPGANLTAAVAYNQLMFEEDLGQQYKYTEAKKLLS